jgi:hypothetical protein
VDGGWEINEAKVNNKTIKGNCFFPSFTKHVFVCMPIVSIGALGTPQYGRCEARLWPHAILCLKVNILLCHLILMDLTYYCIRCAFLWISVITIKTVLKLTKSLSSNGYWASSKNGTFI